MNANEIRELRLAAMGGKLPDADTLVYILEVAEDLLDAFEATDFREKLKAANASARKKRGVK